jgi:hypothetical protein
MAGPRAQRVVKKTKARGQPIPPLSAKDKAARGAAVKQAHATLFSTISPAHAWTLTFRQTRFNEAGGLAHLNRDLLSKALQTALKRIDRAVFKRSAKRFGKKLRRFCTIEGGLGTGQRLHAHLLIECPVQYMTWWEFSKLVRKEWQNSEWGDWNNKFDPAPDEMATLVYFTKYGADAIDWFNCWPPKESG